MPNLTVQSRTEPPWQGLNKGWCLPNSAADLLGNDFLPLQVFIVQLITAFHHFSAHTQGQCLQASEDRIGSTSGWRMVTCSHLCVQTTCPLSQSWSISTPPARQIHFFTPISGSLLQNSLRGSLVTRGDGGPVELLPLQGDLVRLPKNNVEHCGLCNSSCNKCRGHRWAEMDRNNFLAFFSKHIMKDSEKPTCQHSNYIFHPEGKKMS